MIDTVAASAAAYTSAIDPAMNIDPAHWTSDDDRTAACSNAAGSVHSACADHRARFRRTKGDDAAEQQQRDDYVFHGYSPGSETEPCCQAGFVNAHVDHGKDKSELYLLSVGVGEEPAAAGGTSIPAARANASIAIARRRPEQQRWDADGNISYAWAWAGVGRHSVSRCHENCRCTPRAIRRLGHTLSGCPPHRRRIERDQ